MIWRKLGRVYAPDGAKSWARSHAYVPTVLPLADGRLRVYFSSLDVDRVGRIGYVEVDAADPRRVVSGLVGPVLEPGADGTFDDSGVSVSSMIDTGSDLHLYYFGWQRAQRVPYLLFSGAALSHDNGSSFTKFRVVPMLDRSAAEPFGRSAPVVIKDGNVFKMWYVCTLSWFDHAGRRLPTYVVKYAESTDGLSWPEQGEIAIDFSCPAEFGFGRPWVVKDPDRYRMWYSIRSRTAPYRIGYAESTDGRCWQRLDDRVGIFASAEGWDSEMICFPCVVDAGGKRYLFYNGNRHGEAGFGCAVLEG